MAKKSFFIKIYFCYNKTIAATNVELSKYMFDDGQIYAKIIIDLKNYPELLKSKEEDWKVEFIHETRFNVSCFDEKSNKLFKLYIMKTREEYNVSESKWYMKDNGKVYICLKKIKKGSWFGLKIS